MNSIKENIKKVKDAGLQLTGLGYKVMKDKTLTDERQAMLSELSDTVMETADKFLKEAEKMEAKIMDQAYRIESLKKDVAKAKRSYKEAVLEKDTYEGKAKKLTEQTTTLKEETTTLKEQCSTLRQEKEEMKTELDNSRRSLEALDMSMSADILKKFQ